MRDLARSAIAEVDRLAVLLGDATDADRAVHTARKSTKRLRSFLRLARPSIGTNVYRRENAALRDIARLLAPARDSLVLMETAGDLGASESVLATLERLHVEEMTRFEAEVRTDATGRSESAAAHWRGIDWRGPTAASIRAGLARTYRRGLEDFHSVRSQPSATAFHSWRRRVKYVRYQLETVGAPSTLTERWLVVGDDLGWEHDHTVLIGVCGANPVDDGFRAVADLSRARREELRSRALDLGARLFVLEPRPFVRTIASDVDLGH